MTKFNLLTAAAILSAAIATPVSAQQAVAPSVNAPAERHVHASPALPTYEANGLPISPVQVGLLGAANVREQSPTAAMASPLQLQVLTPRPKLRTATAAPARKAN